MFIRTAQYYDALYHFKDYAGACDKLHQLIRQHVPDAKTLLDVACGTGKHIEQLQKYYATAGLDLNPELLEIAKRRCSGTAFYNADMTDFNLPLTYDVIVCLFSSVGYVRTIENLNKVVQCMSRHLNPNGMLVIEPWITPEHYWVGKLTFNHVDQPELKIAWMYTSQRVGLTSVFDIHYMVGTLQGIDEFTEQHVMGLWADDEYKQAFINAGIKVHYDPVGLFGRGMYYGNKL